MEGRKVNSFFIMHLRRRNWEFRVFVTSVSGDEDGSSSVGEGGCCWSRTILAVEEEGSGSMFK